MRVTPKRVMRTQRTLNECMWSVMVAFGADEDINVVGAAEYKWLRARRRWDIVHTRRRRWDSKVMDGVGWASG
jgi:hypothetical protein